MFPFAVYYLSHLVRLVLSRRLRSGLLFRTGTNLEILPILWKLNFWTGSRLVRVDVCLVLLVEIYIIAGKSTWICEKESPARRLLQTYPADVSENRAYAHRYSSTRKPKTQTDIYSRYIAHNIKCACVHVRAPRRQGYQNIWMRTLRNHSDVWCFLLFDAHMSVSICFYAEWCFACMGGASIFCCWYTGQIANDRHVKYCWYAVICIDMCL